MFTSLFWQPQVIPVYEVALFLLPIFEYTEHWTEYSEHWNVYFKWIDYLEYELYRNQAFFLSQIAN